jgi:hypothetical protein
MDYTQLLSELEKASLFDLYRLRVGIGKMMDQPDRIKDIKRRLRIGMEVTYFEAQENRLIPATVEEIQRTKLLVRNISDGEKWKMPFHMINLDGVDTDIHADQGQVDRNSLKVGELVGYHDRMQQEQYGKIIRLNPKTVTLHVIKDGAEWRVPYNILFKVVDGDGEQVADAELIEGEVVSDLTNEPIQRSLWSDAELGEPKPETNEQSTPSPHSQHKIPRNAPCPCGSGRKYKRCCRGKV